MQGGFASQAIFLQHRHRRHRKLLSLRLPFFDMTFMLQLEVARRVTAQPAIATTDCFRPLQHHAEVRLDFTVSSACFVPRPRVTSAVVTFHPLSRLGTHPRRRASRDPPCGLRLPAQNGRKLPRSASIHGAGRRSIAAPCRIDGARRAEDLSVAEYERLALVSLPQ